MQSSPKHRYIVIDYTTLLYMQVCLDEKCATLQKQHHREIKQVINISHLYVRVIYQWVEEVCCLN